MALTEKEIRCRQKDVCSECFKHKATCGKQGACNIVKKQLRDYAGIRFTSDGFDCALPVTLDSHSVCSFSCLYCFAPNLIMRREEHAMPVGQTSLKTVEDLFAGKNKHWDIYRRALKYHDRKNGYPCPIQIGGLTDPLDNIERNQGWFLKFVEIAKKYNQPVRISTKGNLFLEQEYLDALADRPELFWVNFSIISSDDKVIQEVDRRAPPTSERIQCIKNLTEIGVKAGLRFRPIIPGISDSTDSYPTAYRTLIEMAAEAGARNISYEVAFMPGRMTADLVDRWTEIEKIAKLPLISIYKSFGKNQACIRPSHQWTEEIMHAIYNVAKENKMNIGISDPNWKQLTECGCCCGISESDPIFGNWQRESCTNQLMIAKNTGCTLCSKNIIPKWAYDADAGLLVNPGVGPTVRFKRKHLKWSDKLKDVWNNVDKERSPLIYFQGALMPVSKKNGEIIYKYVGLKRRNKTDTPYWKIKGEDSSDRRVENKNLRDRNKNNGKGSNRP